MIRKGHSNCDRLRASCSHEIKTNTRANPRNRARACGVAVFQAGLETGAQPRTETQSHHAASSQGTLTVSAIFQSFATCSGSVVPSFMPATTTTRARTHVLCATHARTHSHPSVSLGRILVSRVGHFRHCTTVVHGTND